MEILGEREMRMYLRRQTRPSPCPQKLSRVLRENLRPSKHLHHHHSSREEESSADQRAPRLAPCCITSQPRNSNSGLTLTLTHTLTPTFNLSRYPNSGSIPEELGELALLEKLDLAQNALLLSGERKSRKIPAKLQNFERTELAPEITMGVPVCGEVFAGPFRDGS